MALLIGISSRQVFIEPVLANQWEEWRMGVRGLGGGHLRAWVRPTGVGLVQGGVAAALVSHSRAGDTGRTAVGPQGQGWMCRRTRSERKGEAKSTLGEPDTSKVTTCKICIRRWRNKTAGWDTDANYKYRIRYACRGECVCVPLF